MKVAKICQHKYSISNDATSIKNSSTNLQYQIKNSKKKSYNDSGVVGLQTMQYQHCST